LHCLVAQGLEQLCDAVRTKDAGKATELMQSPLWTALLATVGSASWVPSFLFLFARVETSESMLRLSAQLLCATMVLSGLGICTVRNIIEVLIINRSSASGVAGASSRMGAAFGEFGAGTGPVRPSTAGGGGDFSDQAEQLSQMGFDKKKALEILQIVNGNMELALDMLSSS